MFVMPPAFNSGDTIYFPFDTYDSNGASVTITGLAVTDIEVYKNGSTTQRSSDNGYALLDTDGIDFDGTTGLHGFSIDTSDNSDAGFWADGAQYWVNINAITVDGQTVRFTYYLVLGYLLRPTTAGRKLDVSTGGEAGLDWANIGSPTTTQGLSGTTVKTATDVETDTQDIQSRLPAALGANGNIKADVRDYNGVAGTFSGGRPEVNTSHLGGSAIQQSGGYIKVSEGTGTGQHDLTAGRIGIDWAKISNPTTTVGLSGTTVKTATDVETDTQDIQSRLPAALTGAGNMKSDVLALSGDATAADNLEAALDGTGGVVITASITGNVTGNLSGTIGGFTTSAKAEIESEVNDALVVHRLDELVNADSDIDGAAPPTVGSVFFELMTKTTGSFTFDQTTDSVEAIRDNQSSGSGDWTSGEKEQIRKALGVTGTSAATTGTGNLDAVKTKTDQLTFTVANRVDATASSGTLGSGASDIILNFKDSSLNNLAGVAAWVTTGTDPQSGIVAGTVNTDAFGNTPTLFFDPGTYYTWGQLAGYNFPDNPKQIVVV